MKILKVFNAGADVYKLQKDDKKYYFTHFVVMDGKNLLEVSNRGYKKKQDAERLYNAFTQA